jgi:hypothetical protein
VERRSLRPQPIDVIQFVGIDLGLVEHLRDQKIPLSALLSLPLALTLAW